MLTAEQIEAYRRDGYLVVRQAVDPVLLAGLVAGADRFAALALTGEGHPAVELDEVATGAAGVPLVRRIRSPHLQTQALTDRSHFGPDDQPPTEGIG